MPAAAKVTAAERQQIRRRRAAGETCTSIARDFPIGHQRVSSIDFEERQRDAAEKAAAQAEREAQERVVAHWRHWTVTFDPDARGALYPTAECRLDYWAQRSGSYIGRLNYNDALRGTLLKDELRAMASGRPLFIDPPQAVPPTAG